MSERRLLVAIAGIGLVAGVAALATGQGWAALVAGLCSVGIATLALRLQAGRTGPVPDSIEADFDHLPSEWLERPVPRSAEPVIATPRRRVDDPPDIVVSADVGPHGLLGAGFLETTLRSRIAVARRALRPLSVVHFEVFDVDGDHAMPVATRKVAATLHETLRESDVAGCRADGVYVFVLEETGEDGAVWTAERLRRRFVAESGARRFRAGIAGYPTHGLDVETVDAKAAEALNVARDWNRDRIEVATGI